MRRSIMFARADHAAKIDRVLRTDHDAKNDRVARIDHVGYRRTGGNNVIGNVRLLLSALLLCASACSPERTYEIEGRVVGFGDDHRTLIVEHGDVRGLMPAMTMPFAAADTSDLSMLRVGDAVSFTLHLRGDSSWIREIRKLPDDAVAERPAGVRDPAAPRGRALLEAGDPAPSVLLTTHADTTLTLADLKGRAVVLTFIYTRCPIQDFCPRMTQHFAQLQEKIAAAPELGPIHLLSISFDSAHDTPETLKAYAREYDAELSNWTFATGDSTRIRQLAEQFGVFYQSEGGEILHNLATALIRPDGRVQRIWRGNEWTADEIVEALRDRTMYQ